MPLGESYTVGESGIYQHTSFGQRLRYIRTSLQLTQQDVAERFGVTAKEIDLFERNLPVMLGAKLRILKQLYGVKARKRPVCNIIEGV